MLEAAFLVSDFLAPLEIEEGIEVAHKALSNVGRTRTRKLVEISRKYEDVFDLNDRGARYNLERLGKHLEKRAKKI